MTLTLRTWITAALLAVSAIIAGAADDRGASLLSLGIRQFEDGDFDEAVFTLDRAARRLGEEASRSKDLAQAYLYLGAAYVGLKHDEAAKGKFRAALELEPALRPTPEKFPPHVVKVFETQLLTRTAAQKRRGRRTALILGGVGAAGIATVAATTSKGGQVDNRPPIVSFGTSPTGGAITGITQMTFTANATDPDGDPVTLSWDLGDGTSAAGTTVTHMYQAEGSLRIRLTATDNAGHSATAEGTVVSRTLTGLWNRDSSSIDPRQYACVQTVTQFACDELGQSAFPNGYRGTIVHPRHINLEYLNLDVGTVYACSAEVNDSLTRIAYQCVSAGSNELSRP